MHSTDGKMILFIIYLSENTPSSNLELKQDWTVIKNEAEVLLLPFFFF
jgi:hypothetical protein